MNTILLCTNNYIPLKLQFDFLMGYQVYPKTFDNKTFIKLFTIDGEFARREIIIFRDNEKLNTILKLGSWQQFFHIATIHPYIKKEFYTITNEILDIKYEELITHMHQERGLKVLKRILYALSIKGDRKTDDNLRDILSLYRISSGWFSYNEKTMTCFEDITVSRFNQELNKILYCSLFKNGIVNITTFDTIIDDCKYINPSSGFMSLDYNMYITDLINKFPIKRVINYISKEEEDPSTPWSFDIKNYNIHLKGSMIRKNDIIPTGSFIIDYYGKELPFIYFENGCFKFTGSSSIYLSPSISMKPTVLDVIALKDSKLQYTLLMPKYIPLFPH